MNTPRCSSRASTPDLNSPSTSRAVNQFRGSASNVFAVSKALRTFQLSKSPEGYLKRPQVDAIFDKMKAAIKAPPGSSTFITICGYGGLGKSDLVRRACTKSFDLFRNFIGISAEDEQTTIKCFFEVARQLNIPPGMPQGIENTVKKIYSDICAPATLIVFDNAGLGLQDDQEKNDFPKILSKYLPIPRENQVFCIVVTTRRNGPFWTEFGYPEEVFTVKPFDESEGSKFIHDRLLVNRTDYDLDISSQLWHLLGGLPFAMHQAISKMLSDKPAKYIDDFWTMRKHIEDYVTKFSQELTNHSFPALFQKFQDSFPFNSPLTDPSTLSSIVRTLIRMESTIEEQTRLYLDNLKLAIPSQSYVQQGRLDDLHEMYQQQAVLKLEAQLWQLSTWRQNVAFKILRKELTLLFTSECENVNRNNGEVLERATNLVSAEFDSELEEAFLVESRWCVSDFDAFVPEAIERALVRFQGILETPLEEQMVEMREQLNDKQRAFRWDVESRKIAQVFVRIRDDYRRSMEVIINDDERSSIPLEDLQMLDHNLRVAALSNFYSNSVVPLQLTPDKIQRAWLDMEKVLKDEFKQLTEVNNGKLELSKSTMEKKANVSAQRFLCTIQGTNEKGWRARSSSLATLEVALEALEEEWVNGFDINLTRENQKCLLWSPLNDVMEEFVKTLTISETNERAKCKEIVEDNLEQYRAILKVLMEEGEESTWSPLELKKRISRIVGMVRPLCESQLVKTGSNNKVVVHSLCQFDDSVFGQNVNFLRESRAKVREERRKRDNIFADALVKYSERMNEAQEAREVDDLMGAHQEALREALNVIEGGNEGKDELKWREKLRQMAEEEFDCARELFLQVNQGKRENGVEDVNNREKTTKGDEQEGQIVS